MKLLTPQDMITGLSDLSQYDAPFRGDPRLHCEIACYVAIEDRFLGILVQDRVDFDFGWVVLAKDETGRYRCIDVKCSHPTAAEATKALHTSMVTWLAATPEEVAKALL